MIAIVDYGLGNLGSVANMLKKIGVPARIAAEPAVLEEARALILPGVGHFDTGMRNLRSRGLEPVLRRQVLERGVPVLGICLGMQLLARRSDEGQERGLGWIDADVRRFDFPAGTTLPIPHMGWNELEVAEPALFRGLEPRPRFYFVHSFHVVADRDSTVAAWATYGYRFAAAVRQAHVFGTQFHPEKSHRFGLAVLKNFAEAAGAA